MIKNTVKFEHTIEGKTGHFICDQDTPIPAAKDMLFQFLKYLGQIEDQIKSQQEQAQSKVESMTTQDHCVGIEPKEAM